jgi:type II secretory pathway component PulF
MDIKNNKNRVNKLWSKIVKKIRTFGLREEIYFLLENLSALLSAGMGVSSALKAMKEEADSRNMITIIGEIEESIEDGESFTSAFEQTGILSPHQLSLIRLGETSGRLVENMRVVVMQNEKETLLRSKVRSSLMYGVVVFTLAIVVGVGTAWYTLPQLASFYAELDVELPLITQLIMIVGEFLAVHGYYVIPLFLLVLSILFYFFFSFPKTKFVGHSILFHIPLIRTLIKQAELARFGFLLGTMLDAGMPMSESLNTLPGTTTFLNYQKFYVHLQNRVSEGNSLQKSFSSYPNVKKLFPAAVRQMISASEQSGNLPETLIRIGKMYEQRVETTAKNLPTIIEPILLVGIGLLVGILALGTLMPIYNLGDAF